MDYPRLGTSGLQVSRIALGCMSFGKAGSGSDWALDADAAEPLFRQAVDAVQRIAEERGVSMAQIAMAWVLKNPVVSSPIVGATKEHHLAGAVASLDIELTDTEVNALEEHYTPRTPTYYGSKSGY